MICSKIRYKMEMWKTEVPAFVYNSVQCTKISKEFPYIWSVEIPTDPRMAHKNWFSMKWITFKQLTCFQFKFKLMLMVWCAYKPIIYTNWHWSRYKSCMSTNPYHPYFAVPKLKALVCAAILLFGATLTHTNIQVCTLQPDWYLTYFFL